MKLILRKKQIVLIIGAAVLIFLVIFSLSNFWQALDTRRAADDFENYLLNDFNLAEIDKSERGASFDYYLYHLIDSSIKTTELGGESAGFFFEDIDLEKYERRAREAESLFFTQCAKNPEECHPLWSIMPYCMAQRANLNAQNIGAAKPGEQIVENQVFIKTLEYWRDYLDNREWGKEDLSAVLGVVASEQMCGDMRNIDVESWSRKTIGVETETADIGQNMRHGYERIQILWFLHDRANTIIGIPPYEGLEKTCITPPEKTVLETEDVCSVHYYYRIQRFCLEKGWVEYDRIGKYLKERHSDPEKLICQIGLLHSFRGLFPSSSLGQ